MKRAAYNLLEQWKNNPRRKPLLIFGARQVGKTWLVQEFGKNEYAQVAYINCDKNLFIRNIFENIAFILHKIRSSHRNRCII